MPNTCFMIVSREDITRTCIGIGVTVIRSHSNTFFNNYTTWMSRIDDGEWVPQSMRCLYRYPFREIRRNRCMTWKKRGSISRNNCLTRGCDVHFVPRQNIVFTLGIFFQVWTNRVLIFNQLASFRTVFQPRILFHAPVGHTINYN